MSDHELGMKMVEEEETLLFLEAYEASTGTRLEIEARAERRTLSAVMKPLVRSGLN